MNTAKHLPAFPFRTVVLLSCASAFPALLPPVLPAQAAYHDPKGQYEVTIPDGWKMTHDDLGQLIVSKGTRQVTITVVSQNSTNPLTAQQVLDATGKEFRDQCPTFAERLKGQVNLAGSPGIYSIVTCSDPRSPSVAEISATLTKTKVFIQFVAISPLADYYATLPAFDALRESLHVTGSLPEKNLPAATESQAMTELRKACAVGSFTAEDCTRRTALLIAKEAGPDADSQHDPGAAVYHDPQGRFSLDIPKGWTATAEGENGGLGVQLRSGSNWINILPADQAASTDEVVLRQERKIAAHSSSSRQPPFGNIGIVQLFGHGVELSYDTFTASSVQGDPVESYIGGVGDISGRGTRFLLIVASFSGKERKDASGAFLSVGQSVHLAAQ